ncbi:4-hydroxy-tetrahydrodipicolinate synthase [Pseudonocardia alni]|jgi:4-hydroxy-tetrahydrodipicolinate synthase|uniref:4-hydroxy-tetrahydrodipicolinate synthase n=1 Tax=Pseudonocardia TaxID=1847 RepID=UPI0006CB0A95|nr:MULTISPECIES: 4-hydroxy-tetrahydrodipicolinate synthase [Pseudonocardia]ALE81091.1 dihydrodipicolinate synthase [Pseudonocardia sp. AL041005-10]MBO4237108.1 4-hydroxy-tetrahydrodipicolinate synthase [Pseudonocardia alni]MCM3847353.1 4-hydroxy-tetrahydrodipicolinate synthase [Pseudonocardia sp. DR1-2]NWJ72880.1 4-hydroxy-tetrahydrodipicolinate synthase [Pseudonocardia pini]
MITGSIVAIVTPMHDSGEVDHTALGELVERQVDAGTAAIVSVGTTGESSTLSVLEHTEVMRRTIEVANGRVPVIAGTGANSTDEAIHLTRAARAAGADGALLVTPYYNKPPQEGLYQHFKRIAETVDIPQYLYNVPGRTACDMLPSTVARLAEIPNIVGLKEAKGDLDRVRELVALGLDDFALYSGDDGTARASMLAGFHGDISVTANVAPETMARMCKAAVAGDAETASALDADLAGLHAALFSEPNPIPVKWALAELGLMPGGIRLPLVPLDEWHHEDVRAALRAAGLLS